MNDLIFASTSPRRKELLLQISKRFKFRSPDFQEKKIYDMSSLEISKFNSENKAMSISKILRNIYPNLSPNQISDFKDYFRFDYDNKNFQLITLVIKETTFIFSSFSR